ncbi:hypothetical protein E8E11_008800 [Didymella keratinophila]|nr:hypothetical protein E8E11_008800 [Didymella keratinophila]
MVVTTLISFTTSAPTDNTISQLIKALNTLPSHPKYTLGTKVQDPTTIQITAEWPSLQAPSDLTTSTSFQAFEQAINAITSSPLNTTIVNLDTSIFTSANPPLTEFVTSFFPFTSSPEFKSKIHSDFARFETIYRRRGSPDACGEIGLATGWAEEKDGVSAFVVVRGWSAMGRFEESLRTEEFKEGIPILMGWGVPFDLWHVERRAGGEGL